MATALATPFAPPPAAGPAIFTSDPAAADFQRLLEQSLERHGAMLYRTALGQLGNPDDAQDALQEALLLAYRHRDQFAGRAQLATWLTRIVINAARGLRRKALARPAHSLEAMDEDAGYQFRDPAPSPEARCADRERRERLERLLSRLSPNLRIAIELCEFEGLSCRHAAARLGIAPAALKCRLFRARRRLSELAQSA